MERKDNVMAPILHKRLSFLPFSTQFAQMYYSINIRSPLICDYSISIFPRSQMYFGFGLSNQPFEQKWKLTFPSTTSKATRNARGCAIAAVLIFLAFKFTLLLSPLIFLPFSTQKKKEVIFCNRRHLFPVSQGPSFIGAIFTFDLFTTTFVYMKSPKT